MIVLSVILLSILWICFHFLYFILGINVSDIRKLQEAGLATVGSILQLSTRDLVAIKGFSEAKVEKIREAAKKLNSKGNGFLTGESNMK